MKWCGYTTEELETKTEQELWDSCHMKATYKHNGVEALRAMIEKNAGLDRLELPEIGATKTINIPFSVKAVISLTADTVTVDATGPFSVVLHNEIRRWLEPVVQ